MTLCGIGEMGELYMRSPHMAAGYLGLDDATKQKFLQNPFNPDNPRDRLYRTGDIGRYMPDGVGASHRQPAIGRPRASVLTMHALHIVLLLGMAASGVRWPRGRSGQDPWLPCRAGRDRHAPLAGRGRPDAPFACGGKSASRRQENGRLRECRAPQHPSIRENVTVLRRDINEEHVLVSYFVPHNDNFDVSEIRAYLKTKLPVYAVPSRTWLRGATRRTLAGIIGTQLVTARPGCCRELQCSCRCGSCRSRPTARSTRTSCPSRTPQRCGSDWSRRRRGAPTRSPCHATCSSRAWYDFNLSASERHRMVGSCPPDLRHPIPLGARTGGDLVRGAAGAGRRRARQLF